MIFSKLIKPQYFSKSLPDPVTSWLEMGENES